MILIWTYNNVPPPQVDVGFSTPSVGQAYACIFSIILKRFGGKNLYKYDWNTKYRYSYHRNYFKAHEECKDLRREFEKELIQTKSMREEVERMRKNSRNRTDFERCIEETEFRFEEIQHLYEAEYKKQDKMKKQLDVSTYIFSSPLSMFETVFVM